jgi:putative protease
MTSLTDTTTASSNANARQHARLPELLAPAGDWECAKAAVENGADAVYFGLTRFNARLRANNFTESDLPKLMQWLHSRGVKGYVTFNTLVFTRELTEAADYLRTLIAAGVDAAIVQDIGICRLIRRLSPDFPIHASTQMTVTSPAGVTFAQRLGCNVVVLARENSIPEIARIRSALTPETSSPSLEIFVHGALCVAYSGQCLTSEALGGRSANRGECAQACRMPYELLADGQKVDLGDRRYLLSPQDLAGLEVLPDLVRAGVDSLKIEGRLKSAEYVASITRLYRSALDQLVPTSSDTAEPERPSDPPIDATTARYQMEMAFSRGISPGWLTGIDNQHLVHGRFGKKRGVLVGEITRIDRDRVWLQPMAPIAAGDGVVFDAGRPDLDEEGGRVFEVHPRGREMALTFLRGAVDFQKLQPGNRIWKTSDPQLEKQLRQTYAGEAPAYQRPIHLEVHGRAGQPLIVIARDEAGPIARVESSMPLEVARQQPLDTARLTQQFGRLGGTPFRLGTVANQVSDAVLLPVSELNRIRREVVRQLEEQRSLPPRWQMLQPVDPCRISPASTSSEPAHASSAEPELALLVRTFAQLEAALATRPAVLYCEFEDPKRYREAVKIAREKGTPGMLIYVAPPRIFKPGEDWILQQVRSAQADGVLVRNHEHLAAFADTRRVGDFSLNVANPLTAEYFIRDFGLERVTASYDLNADQLEDLVRGAPAHWFEITLHQHMPMFHMEHCVFCAFLSKGKDYRDCGRPCDKHEVRLRDRVGAAHPLKADAGCRNTVFNARAQTGAEHAGRLLAAGVRRFRLEFLDESAEDLTRLVQGYQRLLRGEISGETLWREFKLINQLGVTRGQLGRSTGADLGVDRWTDSRAYAAAW